MGNNWDNIKLGDAATFYNGYAFKPKDWAANGAEIIRIQNLTQSGKDINYFQGELADRYKVRKGDLLISWSATLGIFEWQGEDAWLNQHIFKVVFNKLEFDKNFFKHLINESLQRLEREVHGSTMKHITKKRFDSFEIPYPPLETQRKIAAILDTADEYRQKTKALIDKYDELAQSLFLDMFGDPVTNPKGWEEAIFTDVLVLRRGFDLPVQARIEGEYPIMASNGVLDWHNEFKVKGPGVVTGRSGTLGQVHLIEQDYWPLNTALYSQDMKNNNPIYLLFLLRNFRVERFTRGAGVPTLNRNLVHAEKIMRTPLELQNQFAERVQAIEFQKSKAQDSLAKSEELFNSLLQKAFKGELV